MRVGTGRILALASETAAGKKRRTSFVLAEADGTVVHRGELPAELEAETVIIGDYALLADDTITRLRPPRIGLIAPRGTLRESEDLSPVAVMRAWIDEGIRNRAVLRVAYISTLRPHLQARAELLGSRKEVLARIHSTVATISERYLALLSDEGELLLPVLPILKSYPAPRDLDGNGVIALAQAIDQAAPRNESVIDDLLALSERHAHTPPEAELAASMLPGDIDLYLTLDRQLRTLDRIIHSSLQSGAGDASAIRQRVRAENRFSLFATSFFESRGEPSREAAPPGSDHLLSTIAAATARRNTDHRNPRADYELYCTSRPSIPADELTAEDELQLEISGQLLALAAGKLIDATRHRSACDRLLSATRGGDGIPDRLRVDAEISLAITEVCAVDLVQGFSALRRVVENPHSACASPELRSEASGLLALIIVFFGEYLLYPEALQQAKALIDEHGAAGSARAPAAIAELFLIGGDPETEPAKLEEVRSIADAHSEKTVYRSFYHYVMMLSTYITKEVELGLQHYSQIKQEGLWARFNRRFERLSRLAYSIHLAARGEFAAARRELGRIEASYESVSDGADFLIQGLFSLRLDLAVGRHQAIIAGTRPDAPFGELRIEYIHLRRYLPTSLVLRGTALLREGEESLAIECFERATRLSAMSGEWYALLAAETLEYRQWLETLKDSSESDLPGRLTPQLLEAITSRPVLVQRTLEALTVQQTRILRLLAQNRSAASIASELHITNNTLKSHLRLLYRRLGVRSREQAVFYAEIYGLL